MGQRKASAGGKRAPNGVVVLESPMPNSPALAITVSVSVPYKLPAVLTVMVLISTGTLVMELLIVTLPGGPIGKCCARTANGHRCCRKGTGDQHNYAPSHWLLTSLYLVCGRRMRPMRARQADTSLVRASLRDRQKARVVAPALEKGGARTVAGAAARLSGKPVSARPGLPSAEEGEPP
jgi:hypothetical protein